MGQASINPILNRDSYGDRAMKALIVGAGLAGLTAGVLLKRKKWDVRVVETRAHPGGNCIDVFSGNVHVHMYGPHIFHTGDNRAYRFFSEMCGGLTGYLHKVVAQTSNYPDPLPIPYSQRTAQIIGRDLSDQGIEDWFFRLYSQKMWGMPYEDIPDAIKKRVPRRRLDYNTNYFQDAYQGMPSHGYAFMFNRMIDEIGRQNCVFGAKPEEWRSWSAWVDLVVYTGRMDAYYKYEFGPLPYRAIQFRVMHSQSRLPNAVINWCDLRPDTRTTDYSRFYDEPCSETVIGTETPCEWEPHGSLVPSYPMRGFPEVDIAVAKYDTLKPMGNVLLCGRLGAYQYMNMDAVISDTMAKLENRLGTVMYV